MSRSVWTAPNILGILRLLGSPGLILLALGDASTGFLFLFLTLEGTDWLDGKLAVRLDQRTTFGSRLDSVADMAMYGALLVGLMILEGGTFLAEWPWMVPAVAGYAVSWGLSFWKFGTLPSYHAWSAKISWLLAVLAAVALLALNRVWPVRVAAAAVAVANLEAILLTLRLDRPRSDVPSIFAAAARSNDDPPEGRSAGTMDERG